MSERKASSYINDILTCIEHINTYTNAFSFDKFASDFMVIEACLYNIQVIGEAASKIPDDLKRPKSRFHGYS